MSVDIDSVIGMFFNVQTIFMMLGVYVITYVIRTIVETVWTGSTKNKYWEEIFIPLGAIINGAMIGLCAKALPTPVAIIGASWFGRAMYGAICGSFSALAYNRTIGIVRIYKPDFMVRDDKTCATPVASPAPTVNSADAPTIIPK